LTFLARPKPRGPVDAYFFIVKDRGLERNLS
jgi:hypothetical protein